MALGGKIRTSPTSYRRSIENDSTVIVTGGVQLLPSAPRKRKRSNNLYSIGLPDLCQSIKIKALF